MSIPSRWATGSSVFSWKAVRHRAVEWRATESRHRPRRLGAGLHLVLGLRHRRDPHADDALHRHRRVRPRRADHVRDPRRAVLRHHELHGRHQVLHDRRRLLRRGARQFRSEDRPDRRGGAVDRLHRHRRGPVLGRHGGLGEHDPVTSLASLSAVDHPRRRTDPDLRQPARSERGGELLRAPDVLLHRDDDVDDPLRFLQEDRRIVAPHPAAVAKGPDRPPPRLQGHRDLDGPRVHLAPSRLRQRRLVVDGSRSDLQRRGEFPSPGVVQRAQDPRDDVEHPGLLVARHHAARGLDARDPLRRRLPRRS